jgi:hypothetical protein
VEEKHDRRKLDGARYSIFELKGDAAGHEFSHPREAGLREVVQRLAPVHAAVLELAATAHWLAASEKIKDWKAEIIRSKGSKASEGRLAEATQLLAELGLPPSAAQA